MKTIISFTLILLLAFEYLNASSITAGDVELKGKLRTGTLALGGETTGVELNTEEGQTYELALQGELMKKARSLSGKDVVVKGTLKEKKGVEISIRKILRVHTIERFVTIEGSLIMGKMALGGETTGVELKTEEGQTYELALKSDLMKKARTLSGQAVLVKGTLKERKGVEVAIRKMIEVTKLEAIASK